VFVKSHFSIILFIGYQIHFDNFFFFFGTMVVVIVKEAQLIIVMDALDFGI
jgi:hypothetical protein